MIQLIVEAEVNSDEDFLRLRRGIYSPISTSPSANNY